MREELSVEVPMVHINTFLPANAKLGHFWAIYQGTAPIGWEFIPTEEVPSVITMSMQELSLKLESSPELFTHGFINTFAEFNRIQYKDK